CSDCGFVMSGDQKLTLADREWTCPQCGTYHIRDHNAARNILAKGLALN
ncbi:zinc ribbon domain-containing protein, partial [Lacticaseibacillus yichunensis]